ncbi:hypothetical protein Efla_005172 [Eimeria flavescens]
MDLQASAGDLVLKRAQKLRVPRFSCSRMRPNKSQYLAPRVERAGSVPSASGFQWDAESLSGGDVSFSSGDAQTLPCVQSDQAFLNAPVHGAAGNISKSGSLSNKVLSGKHSTGSPQEAQTEKGLAQDQADSESSFQSAPQRGDSMWSCARCSEVLKEWANAAWSRETVFILKEEQRAKKGNPTGCKTIKPLPQKRSHAIVASKAKGSRDSLLLCPLRFTDKSMEAEFAFNQERSARFRNVLGGLIASFLVVVDLSVSAAAWQSGIFMHDTVIFTSYMIFLACCTIFCAAYAISHRIPYVRDNLEYTSYFIATSAVVTQSCLAIWWKTVLYGEENYAEFLPLLSKVFGLDMADLQDRKTSVVYHIFVLYDELLLGIFLQSTLLCVFLLFDVLTPTRFFIATKLQILNTLVGIIPFVYGAIQLPETLLPNMASIVCIFTISAAGILGSYPVEVCSRGLFYEWLSMKRTFVSLLEARRRAQKAAGSSSVLDDIRSNCTKIGEILNKLKKGTLDLDVSTSISQALTLTQECLFIFATCKDLYLASVNEELKDESFIKAFSFVGPESPNLLNAKSAVTSTIGRPGGLMPAGEKPDPDDLSRAMGNADEMKAEYAGLLIPVIGVDLDFNPLEFERAHGEGILLNAGTALLSRVASDWGCDNGMLRNFLVHIDALYQRQPYHNSKHGTLVAHTMSLLCRTLGIFREMNSLGIGSCLVASLCHDVGHPGRNNNFFVSEMSPLSIVFNDASVLENFHCSLTFRVLSKPSCNLFAFLADSEAREVRSKIIDLILATDMRTHFDFLSRFRTIRGSDQYNHAKNEDDRWLAAELCIRASDIGHGALSWEHHFEWTGLATTEFYLQGDEETRLGRTISPLCDRASHSQMAKSQVGFLTHVVRPLFVELNIVGKEQKTITDALKNLDDNCDRWEALGETVESVVFPRSVRDIEKQMMVRQISSFGCFFAHDGQLIECDEENFNEVGLMDAHGVAPPPEDHHPTPMQKANSGGPAAISTCERQASAKFGGEPVGKDSVVSFDQLTIRTNVASTSATPEQPIPVASDDLEQARQSPGSNMATEETINGSSAKAVGEANRLPQSANEVRTNRSDKADKPSPQTDLKLTEEARRATPSADNVQQSAVRSFIGGAVEEESAAAGPDNPAKSTPPSARSNPSSQSDCSVHVPENEESFFGV